MPLPSCDMEKDCVSPVTHIGEKGYVYCAGHVGDRRGVERCRKMRAWEVKLLAEGKPLPSYKPIAKSKAMAPRETTLAEYCGAVESLGETVTVITEDGRTFRGSIQAVRQIECLQHLVIGYSGAADPLYQADLKKRKDMDECDDCGAMVPEIVGCPDGAEICRPCFNAGAH
jgi:hypothetical protein